MAQCLLGAPLSDGETFLVFTYIWLKDVEKISKMPSAPRNENPARAITWLVGVPIHCTILKYQSISISPVFPLQNSFEKKKLAGEMLVILIIEFELRGPGPPGRKCTPTGYAPTTGYFYDTTKIAKENLRVNYYILLKYCSRQCT